MASGSDELRAAFDSAAASRTLRRILRHAFRKACGSLLLKRAGKDPRQVQQWLGHSQLTTTMNVYVHELDDGLGGADDLDVLWGHLGATQDPETAASAEAVTAPETAIRSGNTEQPQAAASAAADS
jgi:hypothetical protein